MRVGSSSNSSNIPNDQNDDSSTQMSQSAGVHTTDSYGRAAGMSVQGTANTDLATAQSAGTDPKLLGDLQHLMQAQGTSAPSQTASPGPRGSTFDKAGADPNSPLGKFLAANPSAQAINVGDGRVAIFNKDGTQSGFGVFDKGGAKLAPPGDGLQPIDPSKNGGLGSMTLGGNNYLNFDTNGISVDSVIKNKGVALGYDAQGKIAVGTQTAAPTTPASGTQGTDFDKTKAAPDSALGQYLAAHPDTQALQVDGGGVAIFHKDASGAGFAFYNSDGSKKAPPGDGLQPIDPSKNDGKGTMVLGPTSYLNFDANGISVDSSVKVEGTPLGFDEQGNIGVGIGSVSQMTEQANPFYQGNGIESGGKGDPIYPSGSPDPADVNQKSIGDCYMDAALASIANTPAGKQSIQNAITQTGTQPPAYDVKMFDPTGKPVTISVSGAGDKGNVTGKDGKENWATVMEAAWTKYNDQFHTLANDFQDKAGVQGITGGQSDKVFAAFLGTSGGSVQGNGSTPEETGQLLSQQLAEGQYLAAGTNSSPTSGENVGKTADGTNIVAGHAYSVLSVDQAAQTVTVRNPWGTGDKNDGNITMSLADFNRLFGYTFNSGSPNSKPAP